jgi:hypothetical protein
VPNNSSPSWNGAVLPATARRVLPRRRRGRDSWDTAIVDRFIDRGRRGNDRDVAAGSGIQVEGGGNESGVWAFRYRVGGRGSRRVQRGGFASERDASEGLERALERVRRDRGCGSALTLGELVDGYLAQHDGEPETIAKLRWLLTKPVKAFGHRRLPQLHSQEIAAWRMTVAPGHRFEATQALRQVLARAVDWGMIDVNPAKQGVDNPQRR